MNIKTSIYVPKERWEFPYDRYIEYGPEDLWWAVKYGFGKYVPLYYIVGNEILMHPDVLEILKKEVANETS